MGSGDPCVEVATEFFNRWVLVDDGRRKRIGKLKLFLQSVAEAYRHERVNPQLGESPGWIDILDLGFQNLRHGLPYEREIPSLTLGEGNRSATRRRG